MTVQYEAYGIVRYILSWTFICEVYKTLMFEYSGIVSYEASEILDYEALSPGLIGLAFCWCPC